MDSSRLPDAADNGLLDRRTLLRAGLGSAAALLTASAHGTRPDHMRQPGAPMSGTSPPATELARTAIQSQPGTLGSGASRTPLQHLDGLITPSRLHFERHHAGIPTIAAHAHRLVIHGRVKRPLVFDLDALHRYPIVSRLQFLECSGNSAALLTPQPADMDCGAIHGLISASEWGGVPLNILLDEAGIEPGATWAVASGADAPAMNRSVPLEKLYEDAIVALYQNGEPLRRANGYPMRLFLPGWEGNASVKWLRALQVTDQPAMSRQETSKYSDLDVDGNARLFTFPMGVKSIITSPSPGLTLGEHGIYQISGLAWSGAGRIRGVEVSADGGKTWAEAQLDDHVLDKCLTRFRAAWRWRGAPAVLMSRATDATGAVQPDRAANIEGRATGSFYHVNAIQAWAIDSHGAARNVYA